MKNRLVVLLAGLSLGVLAACGNVTTQDEAVSKAEPAQMDPQTHEPFCYMCPVAPGGTQTMATRKPVYDEKSASYVCYPCDGGTCGDGYCDLGESTSCPSDCGGGYCGDGFCGSGESCSSCSADCGTCAYCGDGYCNNGETCSSCPGDCGSCPTPYCGDGVCNNGEDCSSCSNDCGSCGPVCGDGICEYPETRYNCRADCYITTCIYACP